MTRAMLPLLALVSPLLAGCGTLADAVAGPPDDRLYYRGVRMDVAAIKVGAPVMALDVPFSACADTLMVPSIAYQQWKDPNYRHKSAFHATGELMAQGMGQAVGEAMATMPRHIEARAEAEIQRQRAAGQLPPTMQVAPVAPATVPTHY